VSIFSSKLSPYTRSLVAPASSLAFSKLDVKGFCLSASAWFCLAFICEAESSAWMFK